MAIPLYTFKGRGSVSVPISLTYNSNVYNVEGKNNEDAQVSWVGMGWGLEVPYIFGVVGASESEGQIEEIGTEFSLYWDGVADGIAQLPLVEFEATYRKYWNVDKDSTLYNINSFTLTDLDGTKYTFAHKRRTILTLWDKDTGAFLDVADRPWPYRWDLTKIEDVTGQNSITIEYDDVDVVEETYSDSTYTQASYIKTITDDASGRVVSFLRDSRLDYPSSTTDPAADYELKRLSSIQVKSSPTGSVLHRFDFTHSYFSSGATKKLILTKVTQKDAFGGGLPSWKFTYRSSGANPGALEVLTTPQGGTRTFEYGQRGDGDRWRLKEVTADRKMGGPTESIQYAVLDSAGTDEDPVYTAARVYLPDSTGSSRYEMLSDYGSSSGALQHVFTYAYDGTQIGRTDYTLADTTVVRKRYSEMHSVVFEAGDSLKTSSSRTFSELNGLPSQIIKQVSPYDARFLSYDPTDTGKFYLRRDITYAAEQYSGMDTTGTHQLAAVFEELVIEKYEGTYSPIAASWTTWVQQSGQSYYRPEKTWRWTGDGTTSDNSLPSDPPNTSEKVVTSQVDSSDVYGHIIQSRDGEGRITKFYYGDNSGPLDSTATGLDHRFLTGVRRLKASSPDNDDDLITKTFWDGDAGVITKVEDANGTTSRTEYDSFWRPQFTYNHDDSLVSRIDYAYSRTLSGTDTFDPAEPNYTRTVRFVYYGSETDSLHSTTYTDGLGRTLQSQVRNGSDDIVQASGYYPDGSLRGAYVPYQTDTDHAYHNPRTSPNPDSTYYEYQNDPRRRATKTISAELDTVARAQTTFAYGLGTLDGQKYQTVTVTDPDGVDAKTWVRRDGSVYKSTVDSDFASRTWTDALGRTTKSMPPRASESSTSVFNTDLTWTHVGQQTQSDQPDQGTSKSVYNRNLEPIYVQEAFDASGHDFWATQYDAFGRVRRVGKENQANGNWYSFVPATADTSWGGGAGEWRKVYQYDENALGGTSYAKGRLTKVLGNWDSDGGAEFWEKYRYSRQGWITETKTFVDGFGVKGVEYDYDTAGRLRKVRFEEDASDEKFFLWYDYDEVGRLFKIWSDTTDTKPDWPTAEYAYNARGQATVVKVRESDIGTVRQQIDYTYAPNGWLTKINNPESLSNDRFAMQLGYTNKVTGGPSTGWVGQRNGNISQIKWVNTKFSTTSYYYTFGYDELDQITKADNSNDTWDISTYTYDDNGNMTLRKSTTHYYETNTNRIDYTSSDSADRWGYDASGRINRDDHFLRDITGSEHRFPGAAETAFEWTFTYQDVDYDAWFRHYYNASNRRVRKMMHWDPESGEGGGPGDPWEERLMMMAPTPDDTMSVTNYVRDAAGNVLAVYDGTDLVERYVWGPTGLISFVKGTNASASRYFTITDHIGSIRAVTNDDGTANTGYDYYPFGLTMRASVGAGSRFKFAGKELDEEEDFDFYYFEAWFYDARIGRFVSPDPIQNGPNPYSYVNNNPLRLVDPSGMIPDDYDFSNAPWEMDYWDFGVRVMALGRQVFTDASDSVLDWGAIWQVRWDARAILTRMLDDTDPQSAALVRGLDGEYYGHASTIGIDSDEARDILRILTALGDYYASINYDLGGVRDLEMRFSLYSMYMVLGRGNPPKLYGLAASDPDVDAISGLDGNGNYAIAIDFSKSRTDMTSLSLVFLHEVTHIYDHQAFNRHHRYGLPQASVNGNLAILHSTHYARARLAFAAIMPFIPSP